MYQLRLHRRNSTLMLWSPFGTLCDCPIHLHGYLNDCPFSMIRYQFSHFEMCSDGSISVTCFVFPLPCVVLWHMLLTTRVREVCSRVIVGDKNTQKHIFSCVLRWVVLIQHQLDGIRLWWYDAKIINPFTIWGALSYLLL